MPGRIPKIVIIGPSYVDMAIKCNQFPQPGTTVKGSGFSCVVTGSGPNSAIEAALCDCEVNLLSKVGDDTFGEMIKENVSGYGVNTDFVYKAQAMSTGITVTMVDSLGENSSCASAGANRALSSDEVGCASVEQLIGSADICLIHGDLPGDVISTVIRTANLCDTKVLLDIELPMPNYAHPQRFEFPKEYYSVDVLIANFSNSMGTSELTAGDVHKLKLIGSEFVANGIESVVINMHTRGVFVADRQATTHVPAFDLETVDHAACHDAFSGALAASCGAGDELRKAVRFAAAADALARAKFGSQDAIPTKEKIIELLQKQPD